MKKITLVTAILMAALLLAGCASTPNATPSGGTATAAPATAAPATNAPATQAPAAGQETIIKAAGSTSVAPLMGKLKEAFEAKNGTISIEVQESGSSAGITSAIEGAAEIAMSSRDLKQAEKDSGLVDIAIALDGIAIVVNPENPVKDLTAEQITDIFQGKITKWSEVGGEDADIIVISREDGSGTRGAFEELMGVEELHANALIENSTGAVKSNVASTKNGIGYISLGSLDDTVTALSVGGAVCSVETIKDGSYVVARPFLLATMGEAQGDAKTLIDFILSEEGQQIVVDNSYISVN